MLDDVTLLNSAVAYLYRDNPTLQREDNLRFLDRITASGVDVPDFSIQGSEIVLSRRPSPVKGGLEIRVGSFGPGPQLRLLVSESPGNKSVEMTHETGDIAWEAFQASWGATIGQPLLTEVTLQLTVPAPSKDSKSFLLNSVSHMGTGALHHLGREVNGFGIRFMSGPPIPVGSGPTPVLAGADVQIQVETFLQDMSQLFLQVMVKWPALTIPDHALPAPVRAQMTVPVLQVNPVAQKPSTRLAEVYDFVVKDLLAFLRAAGDEPN